MGVCAYGLKDAVAGTLYLEQVVESEGLLPALTPVVLMRPSADADVEDSVVYTLSSVLSEMPAISTSFTGYLVSAMAPAGSYKLNKQDSVIAFFPADSTCVGAHHISYIPALPFQPVFSQLLISFDDYARLVGDVNLDGQVDVSDVTSLVDIILDCWGNKAHGEVDMNMDSNTDVNDVTDLVNIIPNLYSE